MAAFTSIAIGVGLALSAAGLGLQAYSQNQMSEAQEDAEEARKKQMNLDSIRRRREAVREALTARSMALSNATASGAADSSGLQGGYGQIGGRLGQAVSGVNQSEQLGTDIFSANAAYADAASMAYLGQGAENLGKSIAGNAVGMSKIGSTLFAGGGNFTDMRTDSGNGLW
jgi:hypothetical protein